MIRVNKKFFPKEPFKVLVSGGIDSIVASHWLKFRYRCNFSILHFNHNVQTINDEMEETVKRFANDFDIEMESFTRNVSITPRFTDISEHGLRNWRLHMLSGVGGNFITAHHLNDAVESYLMKTFNGTPERIPIPWVTDFDSFIIYHPFLESLKSDFESYAKENNLNQYVVEDPTNYTTKQTRNWVRNIIVPELQGRDMGIETVVRKKFYMA